MTNGKLLFPRSYSTVTAAVSLRLGSEGICYDTRLQWSNVASVEQRRGSSRGEGTYT